MKRTLMTLTAVVATGLLLSGCVMFDDMLAEQAVDSVDLAQNESALTTASLDLYDGTQTPELLAEQAAGRAHTFYQPAGCVTAVFEGRKVTYTLDDCTGPFGMVHMTGTVVAIYSPAMDGIQADITSTGLQVNRAVMDVDAQALLTFDGADRNLQVATSSTGYGPRGHQITRTGDYTMTWNFVTQCLGLDGTWDTRIDGAGWTTTVDGWERCGPGCPAAGARIQLTGSLRNTTLTVDYDGSDRASWESSRGGSGTVNLFCVP